MDKFIDLLNLIPHAIPFFRVERNEKKEIIKVNSVDITFAKQGLGAMSSDEKIMVKFLVNIFTGSDEQVKCSLLEIASTLDVRNRMIIIRYLTNPFFV